MEVCSSVKVVVTIMYVSVRMHLIVHLKGIRFTVCNLQHGYKKVNKRTWALGLDPNLKPACAIYKVPDICAVGSSFVRWGQ